MFDLVPEIEHKIAGIGVLAQLAIDQPAYGQGMRVGDLVGGGDPGADGGMGVKALAQRPLRRAMLPCPFGHIIADTIAKH